MKAKTDKKTDALLEKVIEAGDDRVARWQAIHELIRQKNKKAKREQDAVAKQCEWYREERIYKKTKSKIMGLKAGVQMPPMTWSALIEVDTAIFGKSDLRNTDKEAHKTPQGSNKIVRDLAKAFPQYKVV